MTILYYKEEKGKKGYCIQIVGPAAKALIIGQPIVGNSIK